MGEDDLGEAILDVEEALARGGGMGERDLGPLLARLREAMSFREGIVRDYHHYWSLAHPGVLVAPEGEEAPGPTPEGELVQRMVVAFDQEMRRQLKAGKPGSCVYGVDDPTSYGIDGRVDLHALCRRLSVVIHRPS